MNGVATITLAGQSVGLKFGMPALRRFFEKATAKNVPDDCKLIIDERYTDLGLVHLLYAGYVNDCLMRDKAQTIPFSDFYEFIESADPEQGQEIRAAVAVFEASRYLKPIIEEAEDKKKALRKLNGKVSKRSVTASSGTSPSNTAG